MEISDYELIEKLKSENDSPSITELTNRHTGIYINIVNKFSPIIKNSIYVNDLKEDKVINIYNFALKYDPSKNMKFGTYVGEMTKYICLNLANDKASKTTHEELNEVFSVPSLDSGPDEKCEASDMLEEIMNHSSSLENDTFNKILKYRLRNKPLSWKEIGKKIGLSHEWARKIFLEKTKEMDYLNE